MDILEKAKIILKAGYVCDHCLGRQFANLLTGTDNAQRGKAIRMAVAMDADSRGSTEWLSPDNFRDISFHSAKISSAAKRTENCIICNGFFDGIDKWTARVKKVSKGLEFPTFLVGTLMTSEFLEREEKLWEAAGSEGAEPMKVEINREIGKRLENILAAEADLKNPAASIMIDIEKNRAIVTPSPVFIYGEYQKLVRGIPQTEWFSRRYPTSVEQIVAKPFMKMLIGKSHKLHGLGREDIDARCLGWRPFVIEIVEPSRRVPEIASAMRQVNKSRKVRVRKMRISNMAEVRQLKDSRARKEYAVDVICDIDIGKTELKKLNSLVGEIMQKTPTRVMRRRADLLRKRSVFSISARITGKRKFRLKVLGDAGLYIKELVSGDCGRTVPSVSAVLGCNCKPENLDVIKIIR